MSEDAIALEGYERLAEAYAARIDTKAHNAYYERPATLSLLPPVKGKRVLDAGCGPGVYAEWLVNHGAEVVGVDASPKMVDLANQRLQGKARILQASLGPLDFLEAASFDLVISRWRWIMSKTGTRSSGNFFASWVSQAIWSFRWDIRSTSS